MKLLFSVPIFCLLLGTAHAAGPVAYTACITACFATCIAGPGCAACVPVVCSAAAACYHDNTTVETTSGVKKIQDVEQGERVLAIMDGKEQWTEVTFNMNIPVTAPGFFFKALDSVSGEEYKLHVTANHNVPAVDASEESLALDAALRGADGKKSFERLAKIVAASDLEIGNILQVVSANKKDLSLAKVTSIQSMKLDSKNVLFTAGGTVLTNGVLTAASCDVPRKETSLMEYVEKSIKDTEYQKCAEQSVSKGNISETFSKAGAIGTDNGNVYATDLFVYLLKHCAGIIDIVPEILLVLDEDISPTGFDTASLVHTVLKEKVRIYDANGDNMIDHIELLSLNYGMKVTAIDMNPYLCEKCLTPIDVKKFTVESDEVATGIV